MRHKLRGDIPPGFRMLCALCTPQFPCTQLEGQLPADVLQEIFHLAHGAELAVAHTCRAARELHLRRPLFHVQENLRITRAISDNEFLVLDENHVEQRLRFSVDPGPTSRAIGVRLKPGGELVNGGYRDLGTLFYYKCDPST